MRGSRRVGPRPGHHGFAMLDVIAASFILAVACAGLLAAFSMAVGQNQNFGELATRTVDYSQDKLEQLMALDFDDGATNTTVYPPAAAGGTGLGGAMAAGTTVGGLDPAAPVASYVDYLDVGGTLLASANEAFYTRQWSISTDATGNLKTITVMTTALSAGGGRGSRPSTTLVCVKTALQ